MIYWSTKTNSSHRRPLSFEKEDLIGLEKTYFTNDKERTVSLKKQ